MKNMPTRPLHPSLPAARRDTGWARRGPVLAALLGLVACQQPATLGRPGGAERPLVSPGMAAAPAAPAMPVMPEMATGYTAKPGWALTRHAVAAAHPLAAQAGLQLLRAGGNAMDAAVAVQLVLGLVEPQSSGIGGGAFLMHWDGQSVAAWDGRETAPAEADERLFLQADGRPMGLSQAVVGGRAVGVPGALRMLEAAHRAHGRLPWARLLQPAIDLAEQGFPMGPRLHLQLASEQALRADVQAAAYFYRPDGEPWPVGTPIKNPAYAALLRRIASEGSAALYEGVAAQDLVRRVRQHPRQPGRLSEADLATYRPVRRAPLCTDALTHHRVCGMPPPSSGHLAVMQIVGLLAEAPASGPPWPTACPRPTGCTTTPRPPAWPMPTGPSMWPTRLLWPRPWGVGTACSMRPTCASGRA